MTRRTPITLIVFALSLFISGCVHPSKAQIVNNVTPHNGQPVQTVITGTDPYGSCDNYAVLYVNWMSGAQTACVKGNYQTSSLGGGGGMIYPQAGVPVSSGTGWGTSKPAPSGDIVGTTDSQTLTNKFIDGVSPATMAFVDPTSSIQTQLNGKQATITLTTTGTSGAASLLGNTLNIPQYSGGSGGSTNLTIQQGGTQQATGVNTLNCSTNLTCTTSGSTTTITASGSGGGTAPYGYYAMTASGSGSQSIGTDCSSGTPCSSRVGTSQAAKLTASVSFSVPSGGSSNDTAYIYIDPTSKALTVGDQTVVLTCTGCTAVTGITGFPFGSIPLYVATIVNGNVTAVTDDRAAFNVPVPLTAGNCIVLTPGTGSEQIAVDSSNSSCTGGGGAAFNGGTITTPLTISNAGTSGDLLVQKITSNTGYNALGLQDDLGNEWQMAVGGSAATGLPKNSALYMYDKKNSNVFWYVDPATDAVTINNAANGTGSALYLTSANTNATSLWIKNTSTGGHSFNFSSTGSAAGAGKFDIYDNQFKGSGGSPLTVDDTGSGAILTVQGSIFGWAGDATNSFNGGTDTKLYRNATGEVAIETGSGTWGTVDVDNVKLGTDAPPACDSNHVGVINLDASKHLQICDGTAYHTITYTN